MEKIKVLIADDDENLLSGLKRQLLQQGLDVVTCTNADLAVAYAQKHQPNVMVLDIRLDVEHHMILNSSVDGFSIPQRLSALREPRTIPTIYITGDDSPYLELRAKELGACGMLHKPFEISALLKMIQTAAKTKVPKISTDKIGQC